MRAPSVVELEVLREAGSSLAAVLVGVQVDLFVLDAAPQPLDEHVVDPAAFRVPSHSSPVNWASWSVSKISGAPWRLRASSSASTLKVERTHRKNYHSRDEAKADVFDYIERFYNLRRRHSTLGYLSPADYEKAAGMC